MLVERGIYDLELCRVALSCHLALDVVFLWAWSDKQGSDCDTPKHSMCAACYVYVVINTGSTFTGLVMKTGKDRLGPSAPRKWSQSC